MDMLAFVMILVMIATIVGLVFLTVLTAKRESDALVTYQRAREALASFAVDGATTDYQRGYEAALHYVLNGDDA